MTNLFGTPLFEQDLLDAFRTGLFKAASSSHELSAVNVDGVERTLYSYIREGVIQNLESKGYDYLTKYSNFFPIGDVSLSETSRRADGFICDPSSNQPQYVIEIGLGSVDKYKSDLEKTLEVWERIYELKGAFILFFETQNSTESVYYLDGSRLESPRRDDFHIYTLVLPLGNKVNRNKFSKTAYQYYTRHRAIKTGSLVCFTEKPVETQRHLIESARNVSKNQSLDLLIDAVFDSRNINPDEIEDFLDDIQPTHIIFSHSNPLNYYLKTDTIERIESKILSLVKTGSILIIFGEYACVDKYWNKSPFGAHLPISILHDNNKDGKWDSWNENIVFGEDIILNSDSGLDLSPILDSYHYIQGYVKTDLQEDAILILSHKKNNHIYPIMAYKQHGKGNIIWISFSLTGGWPGGKHGIKNWQTGKENLLKSIFSQYNARAQLANKRVTSVLHPYRDGNKAEIY